MTNPPPPACLALPPAGTGPGVLVLHAWWGLNDFFRGLCDRLAQAGFVVAAPDLYGDGKFVTEIEDARARIEQLERHDFDGARARLMAAYDYLRAHPAVRGPHVGAVGFSMGAAYSVLLAAAQPEALGAVVLFYGSYEVDFGATQAAFLGHFAEVDEWEPLEGVRQMETAMRAAGRDVTIHLYPGTGHWFFEADRPQNYNDAAARLAWERTLEFLKQKLPA